MKRLWIENRSKKLDRQSMYTLHQIGLCGMKTGKKRGMTGQADSVVSMLS